jgi:hypothetical protein
MHTLLQHLYCHDTGHYTAQRGGQRERLVVAGAGVQTEEDTWVANFLPQSYDVMADMVT